MKASKSRAHLEYKVKKKNPKIKKKKNPWYFLINIKRTTHCELLIFFHNVVSRVN